MAVHDTNTIDSIFRDPRTDEVLLVMVEHRDWGQRGELLPDLQDKINAYLNFALGGQLTNSDPTLKGKPLHIQLSTVHAPTARENQFFDILCSQVLTPRRHPFQLGACSNQTNVKREQGAGENLECLPRASIGPKRTRTGR